MTTVRELLDSPYDEKHDPRWWMVVHDSDTPGVLHLAFMDELPESNDDFTKPVYVSATFYTDAPKVTLFQKLVKSEIDDDIRRIVALLNLAEQSLAAHHGHRIPELNSEVVGKPRSTQVDQENP